MTMADTIAVMNRGRVEQLGAPTELYERPSTSFVAGFLGVSNLLTGIVAGPGLVRIGAGGEIRLPPERLNGRTGAVAIGVRPEKIRIGAEAKGQNRLTGTVRETAYVGVATQLVVDTDAGPVSVYVQNSESAAEAARPGDVALLSWSPEATFVVDHPEEGPR